MTTDDRLREAYGRAVETRAAPRRAECVSPEALLALVRREGSESGRLATLDHAMACPTCRAELELLRSIERAGDQTARQGVERIRWQRYTSLAIAASALLAVSLGPGRQLLDRDDGGDALRSGGDEVTAVAPARDAVVGRAAVAFAWRPVPGARRYLLEVLTNEGAVAVARQTADTTLVVAPQTLAPGEYHWFVRAEGEDRSERRSGARRLRITD